MKTPGEEGHPRRGGQMEEYCEASLNSLSEELKNEVADHSGDNGNSEIRRGEDIAKR